MLQDYVAAGFAADGFWSLTPRLYLVHMAGARERARAEQKAGIEQAWLAASLSRARRIPPLDKLLAEPGKRPSPEDLQDRLEAMTAGLPKITLAEWRAQRRK